jgi:hypothetical protein
MYVKRYYVAGSCGFYGQGKGIILSLFLVIGVDAALNNIEAHIVDMGTKKIYNMFQLDACRNTECFVLQLTIVSVKYRVSHSLPNPAGWRTVAPCRNN